MNEEMHLVVGITCNITEDAPWLCSSCQGIARPLLSFMSTHVEEIKGKQWDNEAPFWNLFHTLGT